MAPTGRKAVDLVAFRKKTPPPVCWLIEVKDFRVMRGEPSDISGLANEIAQKFMDTLDGLSLAASNASQASEGQHAAAALTALSQELVLHWEPYTGSATRLYPKGLAANVYNQLKILLRVRSYNPQLLNMHTTTLKKVPWTVTD